MVVPNASRNVSSTRNSVPNALVARRGKPAVIVSDNGTEMTSRAVLDWTNRTGVAWHYIAPGEPRELLRTSLIGEPLGALLQAA